MNSPQTGTPTTPIGVCIDPCHTSDRDRFQSLLDRLGLTPYIEQRAAGPMLRAALSADAARRLAPDANTLALAQRLQAHAPCAADATEREVVAALLAAPFPLHFPGLDEFVSAVRVRCNIARAAANTRLAFHTSAIERPVDCWRYTVGQGFTIVQGYPLIDALIKATQPDASGRLYAFSCYRATEYVVLLGLAQELAVVNPALLAQLQRRWERKAIMSGAFHDAFLVEHGSVAEPVPVGYYVPGDRVWFRNPDARSSDVGGFEGSWVIYLGNGLFSNFWQANAPFTLERKCLEVFHWRHGVVQGPDGEAAMDESVVQQRVQQSLSDPAQARAIVAKMMRVRDRQGVYADGGCIDASREYPCFVHPATTDISLPG